MNIYKEAAKVKGFYDMPLWDIEEPFPKWGILFSWTPGLFFSCEQDGKQHMKMSGSLIERAFTTIYQKISYIQGIFEAYHLNNNFTLSFANSTETVERTKRWLREIAQYYNSEKFKTVENKPSVLPAEALILDPIVSHTTEYYIPICHTLKLCPKIVEYIEYFSLAQVA